MKYYIMIKSYIKLSRIYIALFSSYAAAMGFFLGPYRLINDAVASTLAIFFLACGASALNQYQERDIDAKMERTRRRPLPSGAITPSEALSFSLVMLCVGIIMLVLLGKVLLVILGILAVLLYNGLYTHLKKVTAFASVPGGVIGMIPPAIGWVSAGGALFDARLMGVCFIFFMWQIPHFWLLLLRYADDYKKAGLPSLANLMSPTQISRVVFIWIFASSVASLLLPLYGAVKTSIVFFLLIPLAVWLQWNGRLLLQNTAIARPVELFRTINLYLLLVMSLLSIENIFFHSP